MCIAAAAIAISPDERVGGGSNALKGQFPHNVAVWHTGEFICGGALIGWKWVLTTAECVLKYPSSTHLYSVNVGGIGLIWSAINGFNIPVLKLYSHPDFETKDSLYYANVGLMELSYAATPSSMVQLALLPVSGTIVPDGKVGELSGWGATNTAVHIYLQWAPMTTISAEICNLAVGGGASFTAGQICTYGYPKPSACPNDYGAALVDKTSQLGTMILGITAYAGCLDPTHPTVYTNVGYAPYRSWISTISGI